MPQACLPHKLLAFFLPTLLQHLTLSLSFYIFVYLALCRIELCRLYSTVLRYSNGTFG